MRRNCKLNYIDAPQERLSSAARHNSISIPSRPPVLTPVCGGGSASSRVVPTSSSTQSGARHHRTILSTAIVAAASRIKRTSIFKYSNSIVCSIDPTVRVLLSYFHVHLYNVRVNLFGTILEYDCALESHSQKNAPGAPLTSIGPFRESGGNEALLSSHLWLTAFNFSVSNNLQPPSLSVIIGERDRSGADD